MAPKVGSIAILALLLVAGGASAAPSASTTGTIVFSANRAPLAWGEIYRVDTSGTRVDLSRSLAADVSPTLSPNGKLVAFESDRGGHIALYVVGIDGSGLRRVSPLFAPATFDVPDGAQIAWSPNGKTVFADLTAVGVRESDVEWVGDLAGHGRVVGHKPVRDPAWSPDGTRLAYQPEGPTGGSEVDVVTAANRVVWVARDSFGVAFGWGRGGRLAASYNGVTSVYDERGHKLDAWRAGASAWSPDGTELASLTDGRLEVRRSGVGKPFVSTPVAKGTVEWLGNGRVRIFDGIVFVGYDVAHDTRVSLPAGYSAFGLYPPTVSADGNELAGLTVNKDFTATLHIDTISGVIGKSLVSGVPCTEQPWFQNVQFAPGGRSLVYQTGCAEPNADIYSIGADGTGLKQLTDTGSHEIEPTWSPDGTKIAYTLQVTANKCDGCDDHIWVMNADGSAPHDVTSPSDPYHDQRSTWSPDGTQLTFWRWTYNSGEVAVVPAAGGTVRKVTKGSDPVWGPNGITFVNGSVVPTRIDTVQPDGTGATTNASDSGVVPTGLAVSRSGTVAYLRLDGKGRLQLVVGKGKPVPLGGLLQSSDGSGLAFSPDGTQLAFDARDDVGVSDVWLVGADGMHLRRLTNGLGASLGLSWR